MTLREGLQKVRRLSPRKLASNRHRLHPRKFHSFARPHRAQRDRVERSKRASFGPNSADFPAFPFSNWVPAQTRGPNGEGARAAQTWVCSPSPDTSPPPSGLPRSGVRCRSTFALRGPQKCFFNCTTIPTLLFHAPLSALRTLWSEQDPFVPASVQSSVKCILRIIMRRRPNRFEVGVPVRMETIGNRILHDQISEQVDPFHFHFVNRDHQQARQATENANRTYRD
jgi:hypothetical protein